MPQILHAVRARPPRSNAPPRPPTTPPITFLDELLRPELPPLLFPPFRLAAPVELAVVVIGTTVLLVLVAKNVLPSLTVVKVVMTARVALVVISDTESETVLVATAVVLTDDAVVDPWESVGVNVEVD